MTKDPFLGFENVKQKNNFEEKKTAPVFDILDESEAQQLEVKEKKKELSESKKKKPSPSSKGNKASPSPRVEGDEKKFITPEIKTQKSKDKVEVSDFAQSPKTEKIEVPQKIEIEEPKVEIENKIIVEKEEKNTKNENQIVVEETKTVVEETSTVVEETNTVVVEKTESPVKMAEEKPVEEKVVEEKLVSENSEQKIEEVKVEENKIEPEIDNKKEVGVKSESGEEGNLKESVQGEKQGELEDQLDNYVEQVNF